MPDSVRAPWEIAAALTEERLRAVAAIFCTVRKEAVEAHEPSKGDTTWGLGCRSYERILRAIEYAATLPEYRPWLSIVERNGLAFTFAIGGVPVRFYAGDPENPPERAIARFAAEMEQFDLMLDHGLIMSEASDSWPFRLIVSHDRATNLISGITLIQIDAAGDAHNPYSIPLPAMPSAVNLTTQRAGVELPPPVVEPAEDADDMQRGA